MCQENIFNKFPNSKERKKVKYFRITRNFHAYTHYTKTHGCESTTCCQLFLYIVGFSWFSSSCCCCCPYCNHPTTLFAWRRHNLHVTNIHPSAKKMRAPICINYRVAMLQQEQHHINNTLMEQSWNRFSSRRAHKAKLIFWTWFASKTKFSKPRAHSFV